MTVRVSYPGRVCLVGEHCDWAGGASLTVPVPLWISGDVVAAEAGVTITSELDGEPLVVSCPETGHVDREGGVERFGPAAVYALHDAGVRVPPAALSLRSALPTGQGLSSSAAFSLAVLDALAGHAGEELSVRDLAELAYVVEHDLLGVDCGRMDQLACALARPACFEWADGALVTMDAVAPATCFHLVVAATAARGRDTPRILATLSAHHEGRRGSPAAVAAVRDTLASFAEAARAGRRALEAGDAEALGSALDLAQARYEADLAPLDAAVDAPGVAELCRGVRAAGALGAKFSGAGGEGSLIAVFGDAPTARQGVGWLRERGVTAWYFPIPAAAPTL